MIASTLDETTLSRLAGEIEDTGFAVLENVFGPEVVVDALDRCVAELDRKRKQVAALGYEQLSRPPFARLLENGACQQVADRVFGRPTKSAGFRFIRRCPPGGTSISRIHRDTGLRPELSLSVDVLLTDFTEQNGATELWPGTHLLVDAGAADLKRLDERASGRQSVRMTGLAGSVVIRDRRAWHRAGWNRTAAARVMISSEYRIN